MNIARSGVLAVLVLLLAIPLLHAQDLSKYRNFSFGMSVSDVSKQINAPPADVTVVHEHPALIQELTWWPQQPYDPSLPAEPLQTVLFSFYNGSLYRMLATYSNSATEGMTAEDMIRVVAAKYGTATRPAGVVEFPTNPLYRATEQVIARWENPQYSLDLLRSSWSNHFAI